MENRTVRERIQENRTSIIKVLETTPIIQAACRKVGIGRATFYRWRKKDKQFSATVDRALLQGRSFISDMAESQLIALIREKNLGASIFWLKTHHKDYKPKLEIEANISKKLTLEQKMIIEKAIKLVDPLNIENYEQPKQKDNK